MSPAVTGAAPVLVGAYAALPADRAGQERFYEGLADRGLADGLEIPYRNGPGLGEDARWLAAQSRGRFTGSVLTLIPGTMVRVGASGGTFGLASADPAGRRAALDLVREARVAAEELNQLTGEPTVTALHLHSAPSVTAVAGMFARSLDEVRAAPGGWSTRLVLEHCDAYAPGVPGEKRFLSLEDEIPLARDAGIGITVNWGRSAIEAQEADRPRAQIECLAAEGLLEGVMFSGAGPRPNRYGGPWADAHLPLTDDEPTSLLDAEEVHRCLTAADGALSFTGTKIQTPADATVEERLAMVGRVTDLVTGRAGSAGHASPGTAGPHGV